MWFMNLYSFISSEGGATSTLGSKERRIRPHLPSTVPLSVPVGGLFGSGLGYGFLATLDGEEQDGSTGRADGVAVYLKVINVCILCIFLCGQNPFLITFLLLLLSLNFHYY